MSSDPENDKPLNFRQRSVFYFNLALKKYRNNEIQSSRGYLDHIICHQHSIMDQALALERLDWTFGLDVCCLSLELSIKLHDQNSLGVMEFYYVNHMKSLNLLNEKQVMKIEALILLYKLVLYGEVDNVSFGHLMELWKIELNGDEHVQIRSLNNVGCLLGNSITSLVIHRSD